MYTLLGAPGSASWVVHWLLIDLQVDHEFRPVDLASGAHKTPEFLALNPSGVVPVLLIDGEPMCEAAAIALWLSERHPKADLAPPIGSPARARYLQWMFYFANTLQPAFRAWFYPHEPAGPACAKEVAAAAQTRIEAAWQRLTTRFDGLNTTLGQQDYLLGGSYTVADGYLFVCLSWAKYVGRSLDSWPALQAFSARIFARPAVQQAMKEEGLL
jgi:glutathione S-transferase